MKITFSREEVQEIILAHANSFSRIHSFNTVEGGGYQSIPNSVEVSYEEPVVEVSETTVEA